MFVDSSVFVAILSDEEDAASWISVIAETDGHATSGLVILETVMRLSFKLRIEPSAVLLRLDAFLVEAEIDVMPIEARHARLAVEAFETYGKGRGHPAQLDLADCLSYACAKASDVWLLYKGQDFSRTDMATPR